MRKHLLWLPLFLMLWGCGRQDVFEQLGDVYQVIASQPGTVVFDLPGSTSMTAMGMDQQNTIYFCDGYSISVQTLDGGDLPKTLEELTGFSSAQLTMFRLPDDMLNRYALAWTCAGECGDQVCRMVLLDDGTYHYSVTVMCQAESAGQYMDAWDQLLGSVSLENTGS